MSAHECSRCGLRSAKWLGRCPECGAWGTLEETAARTAAVAAPESAPVPYPDVALDDAGRRSTGDVELDRVLGGGLVAGSVVLLGGEPGIGKSTLLLQAAAAMAAPDAPVLYVSGEESAAQVRVRGDRLGIGGRGLLILAETDLDAVVDAARSSGAGLVVVDSVQAVRSADLGALPGSVSQVRECAGRLVAFAKRSRVPVLLVGHVTKDGAIAGPRVLEHVVDAVLQFEGDRHHAHRVIRAVKNRFGPSDELGVFRMTAGGLEAVEDPSGMLLAERPSGVPGSAVVATVEGTRPLLVEVQALVGEPSQGTPRRASLGVDPQRVALILAVLQRHGGLDLSGRDVFVNVPGGLALDDPAADLAVAAALASSHTGVPVPERLAVIGEIGLSGEIRSVARLDSRLREVARLGFDATLVPGAAAGSSHDAGTRIVPVSDVAGALRRLGVAAPQIE